MYKIRAFFVENWQLLLEYLAVLSGLALLLLTRLSGLTGKMSAAEVTSAHQASSLKGILNYPIYAPYKLLQYGVLKLPKHQVFGLRLISVVAGLGVLWLFYRVVRAWYTRRVALLSGLMFACSSWFLHAARGATPIISFAGIVAILWCGLVFKSYKERPKLLIVITLIISGLLYLPGFAWFLLAGAIWQRKELETAVRNTHKLIGILCIVIFVLFLLPIGWGLIQHPGNIRVLAGLPELSSLTIKNILHNIISLPNKLFYHGPTDPASWLKGTPLIDFFGLIMEALGAYSFWYHKDLDRIKSALGLLAFSAVLVVIGGVDIIILLPLIYIFIASGVAFMLQQWLTVFPRNPLAKTVGATVLTLAVLFSCFYQLNNYFVAWKHSPETRQTFSHLLQ